MYVCLCQAVTDQEIREAVEAGATTPCSVGDINGSGTCCGRCRPEIQRLIDNHLIESADCAA